MEIFRKGRLCGILQRPTRVPRVSPEPGTPRGQPRAAPGSAATKKGPALLLQAETSRPQQPTPSGRHGDPQIPSSGAAEKRRAAPPACAQPRSRMRGPSSPGNASAPAARTPGWALPGAAPLPRSGHPDAGPPLGARAARPAPGVFARCAVGKRERRGCHFPIIVATHDTKNLPREAVLYGTATRTRSLQLIRHCKFGVSHSAIGEPRKPLTSTPRPGHSAHAQHPRRGVWEYR